MFLIRVSPNIYSSSTVQLTGSSGYSKECAPSIGWSLRAEPHLSVDVGQEAIPSPHDAAELVREPLAVTPSKGRRPWAGASTERVCADPREGCVVGGAGQKTTNTKT